MIEVTSMNRPDENWRYVDPSGHAHQWEWPDGQRVYRHTLKASLPTVRWIWDEPDDEDSEHARRGHYECVQCGAHVRPGRTADTHRVFVPF